MNMPTWLITVGEVMISETCADLYWDLPEDDVIAQITEVYVAYRLWSDQEFTSK